MKDPRSAGVNGREARVYGRSVPNSSAWGLTLAMARTVAGTSIHLAGGGLVGLPKAFEDQVSLKSAVKTLPSTNVT